MDFPEFWQSIYIPGPIYLLYCKLSHIKIEFFAIKHGNAYRYPPYYFVIDLMQVPHRRKLCSIP